MEIQSVDVDPEKVRPSGNKVLFRPRQVEERESGIILPETTRKQEKAIGTIVAVGPDTPADIKPGSKAIASPYGTIIDFQFRGALHLILRPDDILAVLDADEWTDALAEKEKTTA